MNNINIYQHDYECHIDCFSHHARWSRRDCDSPDSSHRARWLKVYPWFHHCILKKKDEQIGKHFEKESQVHGVQRITLHKWLFFFECELSTCKDGPITSNHGRCSGSIRRAWHEPSVSQRRVCGGHKPSAVWLQAIQAFFRKCHGSVVKRWDGLGWLVVEPFAHQVKHQAQPRNLNDETAKF